MPNDYCWDGFICNENRESYNAFCKHHYVYLYYIRLEKYLSIHAAKNTLNYVLQYLWVNRKILQHIHYPHKFLFTFFHKRISKKIFLQKTLPVVADETSHLEDMNTLILLTNRGTQNNKLKNQIAEFERRTDESVKDAAVATTGAVSGHHFVKWSPIAAVAFLVLIIGAAIFYRECVTGVSPVTGPLFYATQPVQEKSFLLTDGSKALSNDGNILPIEVDFDKKDNLYSESIRNVSNNEFLSVMQFSKSITCKNQDNVISISKYLGGYKNTTSHNDFKDQVSEGNPPILFFNRNISMV